MGDEGDEGDGGGVDGLDLRAVKVHAVLELHARSTRARLLLLHSETPASSVTAEAEVTGRWVGGLVGRWVGGRPGEHGKGSLRSKGA